jgi:cytochrome P450 family 130
MWRDPYPTYARLRDDDPVHRVEAGPNTFWVLSRFSDVFAVANDTATFSSAQGLTYEEDEITKLGLAPTLVMMDRPRHTVFRRLVNAMFTPRAVTGLEDAVRAFVAERVGQIRQDGEVDFVELIAGPVPGFVVACYLGVPEGDRANFGRWSSAIVQANAAGSVLHDAADAVGDLYEYFTGLADRRRREPGTDMVSLLVRSEIEGRAVTTEEVLGFCFVMVAGGNDTASGLLGGSALLLSEHPDQRRLLLEDPSRIPVAVDELLRMTSPVQGLSRAATIPVTLGGVDIPAGAKVHLLYGSANRDPREFGPDADRLDVLRRIPRMMAFGSGPHHCLGAAAARLQGKVVLEELLGQVPAFEANTLGARLSPGPFTRRYESLPLRACA